MAAAAQSDYDLRVLTFEDEDYKGGINFAGGNDWSSLISKQQYGDPLLYGESGGGVFSLEEAYKWSDDGNTYLANVLSEGWGTWCYWSGGHALSNYGSSNVEEFGGFTYQLTVFNRNAGNDISCSGNGHNGSDNFAMHYGYSDNSGWALTEDALPTLYFSDNTARVIDHMYVNNSTYAINCYVNGNSLTASIGEEDWVKIVATGYNGDENTGTAELYLCNGPENIIMDWTKFDLSTLGEVTKVTFNVTGSSDNGYGFSQPAYFAYDDVAVRFPKSTGIRDIENNTATDVKAYDLNGRQVSNPSHGIFIINGKKVIR